MKCAVVLLSGGLDSAVCLAMHPDEVACVVHVDYGQPAASAERLAVEHLVQRYGVPLCHPRVEALGWWQGQRDPAMHLGGRNAVLLALAGAVAWRYDLGDEGALVLGANADDQAIYPDCRREFLDAMEPVLGLRVEAPLLEYDKPAVGQLAARLGVAAERTWSCYYPGPAGPCGACDACAGRARALGA